jgi:hypothetical protein
MGVGLALITGMAQGYSEKLDEEEKKGRKFGEFAFSTLYDNYKTSKKDYDERQNLYIDTATKLREYSSTYGYNVSEGELKEAISSPAFVSEFSRAMTRPDFDPSKVEWQKLFSKVDKTASGEFTGKVEDFIKGEFKMPTATQITEGVLPEQKKASGLFGGAYTSAREKGYKEVFEGAAKASGVPSEALMGASGIAPKTTISGSKSQFEFGAFRPMDLKDVAAALAKERYEITTGNLPDQEQRLAINEQKAARLREAITSVDPGADSFTTMKSNAIAGLAHAKQTGDLDAVKKATNKLTNVMEAEYIAETMFKKKETEQESSEKAMARLQAKAVALESQPDSPEKRKMLQDIDAEIRIRGDLTRKMRGASGITDEQKDRQIGLGTLVANVRRVIYEQYIPSTNLYTTADGNIGIKDLAKPELLQQAATATQEKLIQILTKNGVPVGNAERQLLLANGVDFDANGKAVVNREMRPAFTPLPTAAPATPSQPTAAPVTPSQPTTAPTPSRTLPTPPVAPPTAPPAAAPATPATPKINIAEERQRASNAIAQGAPQDKVKALFKQKTGQDY